MILVKFLSMMVKESGSHLITKIKIKKLLDNPDLLRQGHAFGKV